MINFKDFTSPGYRAKLTTIIDSVNVLVSQGKASWKTVTQKHNAFLAWSSANSISYSQWRCGQTTTLTPTCAQSGLGEVEGINDHLSLFPNPVSAKLNVSWNGQLDENTELSIYDSQGRIIHIQKITAATSDIDMRNSNDGIYTVIMKNSKGQSESKRIVILRQ
jgi:hypothetical protein